MQFSLHIHNLNFFLPLTTNKVTTTLVHNRVGTHIPKYHCIVSLNREFSVIYAFSYMFGYRLEDTLAFLRFHEPNTLQFLSVNHYSTINQSCPHPSSEIPKDFRNYNEQLCSVSLHAVSQAKTMGNDLRTCVIKQKRIKILCKRESTFTMTHMEGVQIPLRYLSHKATVLIDEQQQVWS